VHLASDSGDERSDVGATSQARRVPSLEINKPKTKEKNRTGITTGIEWEKKENLAGDAKGKLLTTGSGKIKGQTGCVCGRSERANETG
jgi:hypothetical protein